MKKIAFTLLAAATMFGATSCATAGTSLSSIGSALGGGSSTGNTISNLIEGVFTTSNISVADMDGQWTIDGSAVAFQSENFLQKAGGVAAAAAIESKLDPYYKQYGLTGGVITIQTDGTFNLKSKRISLNGTIEKQKGGNFTFNFTALGGIKIGSMTTYVQKSLNSMDIMFDATKLQSILDMAAKFTGSKLATTATSLLGSYDGICVGFGTTKTGSVQGESNGSGVGSILNGLFGGGSDNSSNTNTNTNTNTQQQEEETNTGLGTLLELLGGKKK